jgi:hypothetical protein
MRIWSPGSRPGQACGWSRSEIRAKVPSSLLKFRPKKKWTADPRVGDFFKRNGLLLTPEEHSPPKVLTRANELAASSPCAPYGCARPAK